MVAACSMLSVSVQIASLIVRIRLTFCIIRLEFTGTALEILRNLSECLSVIPSEFLKNSLEFLALELLSTSGVP